MKCKRLVLTLTSILVLMSNAGASNRKIRVLFRIPPTAERVLASETRSHILRELRGLHDVEQIDRDPNLQHFLFSIYPVSLKLSSGEDAGIVISYVIEKEGVIEHNVLAGAPDELKVLCEKIVAYFDIFWLQRERKKQK